jgi:hypothetical protein
MNINHGVRNSIYRQSEAVDEAAWQWQPSYEVD